MEMGCIHIRNSSLNNKHMNIDEIKIILQAHKLDYTFTQYTNPQGDIFYRVLITNNGRNVIDQPGKTEDDALIKAYDMLKTMFGI